MTLSPAGGTVCSSGQPRAIADEHSSLVGLTVFWHSLRMTSRTSRPIEALAIKSADPVLKIHDVMRPIMPAATRGQNKQRIIEGGNNHGRR